MKFILVVIALLSITTISFAREFDLCVFVFEDGSEECRKIAKSYTFDGCQMHPGQMDLRENGRKIVDKYRVSTCPDEKSSTSGSSSYYGQPKSDEECFEIQSNCANRCAPGMTRISKDSKEGSCIADCLEKQGCSW